MSRLRRRGTTAPEAVPCHSLINGSHAACTPIAWRSALLRGRLLQLLALLLVRVAPVRALAVLAAVEALPAGAAALEDGAAKAVAHEAAGVVALSAHQLGVGLQHHLASRAHHSRLVQPAAVAALGPLPALRRLPLRALQRLAHVEVRLRIRLGVRRRVRLGAVCLGRLRLARRALLALRLLHRRQRLGVGRVQHLRRHEPAKLLCGLRRARGRAAVLPARVEEGVVLSHLPRVWLLLAAACRLVQLQVHAVREHDDLHIPVLRARDSKERPCAERRHRGRQADLRQLQPVQVPEGHRSVCGARQHLLLGGDGLHAANGAAVPAGPALLAKHRQRAVVEAHRQRGAIKRGSQRPGAALQAVVWWDAAALARQDVHQVNVRLCARGPEHQAQHAAPQCRQHAAELALCAATAVVAAAAGAAPHMQDLAGGELPHTHAGLAQRVHHQQHLLPLRHLLQVQLPDGRGVHRQVRAEQRLVLPLAGHQPPHAHLAVRAPRRDKVPRGANALHAPARRHRLLALPRATRRLVHAHVGVVRGVQRHQAVTRKQHVAVARAIKLPQLLHRHEGLPGRVRLPAAHRTRIARSGEAGRPHGAGGDGGDGRALGVES
mmetsp:Transcript_10079/g.25782  ORF Transcript_10079/g.25782 Transcript_10079/m.25782 type:complete len:606 (+) Transcript_10079:489-2306(+)